MNGIGTISKRGILLVADPALCDALTSAYESPRGQIAANTADRVFQQLTASNWPGETLCRFLANWRATHVTALFVGGLMVRLCRAAHELVDEQSRTRLHRAVAEIAEIIAEDTGVDDTPHNDLFRTFATYVVGDDRCFLSRYLNPTSARFRDYVKEQRLKANLEDAILTTAASENWNAGEYSFFNLLVRPWVTERLRRPANQLEMGVKYISAHAGKTELDHFLHALNAWELYCQATGKKAEPAKAKSVFETYLDRIATVFSSFEQLLGNAEPASRPRD